jgi:serine/threonine protein kinase
MQVASYTDSSVFAFLMLPVADCNLRKYLKEGAESLEKRSFLPNFFGCLSRGLWYLHRQKLQHRDIKPENILVSDGNVLFTDFDSSYSWSHTMHSTAVGVAPRTREYASPEVARSGFDEYARVQSSSDIWSLGCVFLEIITVWKGRSEKALDHLRSTSYWMNLEGIEQWITQLREINAQEPLNVALEWIAGMLQDKPEARPTAHKLAEMTSHYSCLECKSDDSRRFS